MRNLRYYLNGMLIGLALFFVLGACGKADDAAVVGDNNGAITGTWAIIPSDPAKPVIYFESDGFGNITGHGQFDQASTAGTYAVMKTGEVSVTLSTNSADFTITGSMVSVDSASFSYDNGATTGSILKVADTSLLSGNLTGSMTEVNVSGLTYAVDLTVGSDGSVTAGTIGSAAVTSGKAYNASGSFVIFLNTDASGLPAAYGQIRVWGTDMSALKYEVNSSSISGTSSLILN